MKQIIFNTEMVRAILDNRKTVTRRVIKPQPMAIYHDGKVYCDDGMYVVVENQNGGVEQIELLYRPGDILYVRETWQYAYDLDGNEQPIEGTGRYLYAADERPEPFGFWVNPDGSHRDSMPWRPSIHMPCEAARIFLRVTDARVERLQDITNKQALTEGVPEDDDYPLENPVYCPKCKGEGLLGTFHPVSLGYMEVDCPYCDTPKKRFSNLWDSTIKPKDRALYGWDANPLVWVISFVQIGKEEALRCT